MPARCDDGFDRFGEGNVTERERETALQPKNETTAFLARETELSETSRAEEAYVQWRTG